MTWIYVVSPQAASGRIAELYRQVASADGGVDRILQAHSLRPHTLAGHLAIYKAVLHHSGNTLGRATLEKLGCAVSHWNGCAYCLEHHFAGLSRLMKDDEEAARFRQAIEQDTWRESLDSREAAMLAYALKLTLHPAEMSEADLHALRAVGLDDGQILEVNQVVSYFQYANRTVLGLGVSHVGETLGLAPSNSNDESDWTHQ